ncbi:RedB protein [Myxococcus sp. CA051A]|nr:MULTISPECIES: RedB protein [unclassified Myxococcus]NTX09998.1 RedB protein [Myxococcus sp. CA056]NTX40048.1 RedB protein [Myxococcus sp. CA033]NTX64460.1 RedB protein [Myxococcus sp. CA051A]
MKVPPLSRGGWLLMGLLWLVAMVVGFALLARHALTPGTAHESPARWPSSVSPPRAEGRPTLVMLAHPRCPCTRASLGELSVLMEHARGQLDARVLFLQPEGTSGDWTQGPLWRAAAAIPGVTVLKDAGGEQARRFGAVTSGHSLLYDAAGRLRFSGGITGARGHRGDNPGRDAVEALLREAGGVGGSSEHAVYGCALEEPPEARATNTP